MSVVVDFWRLTFGVCKCLCCLLIGILNFFRELRGRVTKEHETCGDEGKMASDPRVVHRSEKGKINSMFDEWFGLENHFMELMQFQQTGKAKKIKF